MIGGTLSGEDPLRCRSHRRLVIVQRNELVLRSLRRYFELYCSDVRAARDHADAERILSESCPRPTDLIVGDNLDPSVSVVPFLLTRWRQRFPTLDRVMVVTATDQIPNAINGIDAVFREPLEPESISDFLWRRRQAPAAPPTTVPELPAQPGHHALKNGGHHGR